MAEAAGELEVEAAVERLAAARDELERAREAIDEVGEERVRRVADAYESFDELLAENRERASGSGPETFQAFVEFEGALETFIGELPDDLRHREAFEAAESHLDRRRLEEADFDRAREAIEPARETAALLEERAEAEERYRRARRRVAARRREVEQRLDEREAILAFEDVDLEAPVDALRDPIDAYNDDVASAFEAYLAETPASEVLAFLAATEAYPLVEVPQPPAELHEYLAAASPGAEPIPTLLEWAEFTRSKLEHYVEDPARFRATVGGNRTALRRLDAEPFQIEWPPPDADHLRYLTRELVAVVDRFAPSSTLERLQAVRALPRRDDYADLRRVARARDALSRADRRRLRDGTVANEAERLRRARDRLTAALEEYPSL